MKHAFLMMISVAVLCLGGGVAAASLQSGTNIVAVSSTPDDVVLPGASAITGFLLPGSTTLQEAQVTVPAGHMQLFAAANNNYGNPVVVIEGFDPTNQTAPADVYSLLNPYGGVDALRATGHSVWIVDFGDGGGALTANAKLVSSAVQIAANWGGQTVGNVVVVGVSMGGVVARYALADDEANNGPSKGLVPLFISGDSPQQGANISPGLQALTMFGRDNGQPAQYGEVNCPAAQSMLYTSVRSYSSDFVGLPDGYEATTAAHDWFYNKLNTLNGNGGYPTSRNVAIANGSLTSSGHNVGDDLYKATVYLFFSETYPAWTYDVQPGSWLSMDSASYPWYFDLQEYFHPTFIPTQSALDIKNGVSKFDRTCRQTTAVAHDVITADTTSFILEEILGNPKLVLFDGTVGLYQWVVTAVFPGSFYIEKQDRSSGIRVVSTATVSRGNIVSVLGTAQTTSGEREIANATVSISPGSLLLRPLALSNRALGGSAIGLQQGVLDAAGLNNIGLLVRTWGKITEIETANPATWFKIDDGSGLYVKCQVPNGVTIPNLGSFVSVTGISSCYMDNSNLKRLLRVRTQSDIAMH